MKEEHIHEVTGRPYLWVSMGGRRGFLNLAFKLDKWLRPYLCKVGIHDTYDVGEADGSVVAGYCGECNAPTKPRKPMPPDPKAVEEYTRFEEYDFCCCDGECKNK